MRKQVAGVLVAGLAALAIAGPAQARTTNLTKQQAGQDMVRAINANVGGATRIRVACRIRRRNRATCTGSWSAQRRLYTGAATITRAATSTRLTDRYVLTATGKAKHLVNAHIRRSGRVVTKPRAPPKPKAQTPAPAPPAPAPAPAPQPAPAPTPPPAPGSTRDNPIPLGTTAAIGDWQVTVLSTIPDAYATLKANDSFTPVPDPGNQYFMASVRATYVGPDSGQLDTYDFNAVGNSAVSVAEDCWDTPDELPSFTDVFTGGTVTGNLCWQVPASDTTSLTMYYDEYLGDGVTSPFFAMY